MRALNLLLFFSLVQPVAAQYYDNQVLEKGFERTDFFFAPSYLNPFGLEGFGPVVSGLVNDPLLDLQFSPSLIRADSSGRARLYLDFRSTRESSPRYDQYPVFLESDAASEGGIDQSLPAYYYSGSSYRPTEPLLSAAVFLQPAKGLVVGATYRVLADDQSFYAVPQDIYRSSPGLDSGREVAGEGPISVVDVYSGTDQMRQFGHFPSLFASYRVSPKWRAGVRAAFARFDRDGESGTSFEQPFQSSTSSISSQFQGRSQSYRHMDLSVGIDGSLSARTQIAMSVGRLSGSADQVREGTNQYASQYGSRGGVSGGDWSNYQAAGFSDARWDRSGGTTYGTLFLRHRFDEARVLTATYRGSRESLDLASWSSIADSSLSESFGQGQDYDYEYRYRSVLFDDRSGIGTRSGNSHRLTVGLDWTLNLRSRLTIGVVGTQDRRVTESVEDVESSRYRFYDNRWANGRDTSERELFEDKSLTWTFSNRQTAVRVPVMLWHRVSEHFEILIGVSREMREWRLSEQTLALFDSRIEIIDGQRTVRHNFGERYREPTEYRTDVSTAGLFGIIASPSPNFDIRLLVSPNWSNSYDSRRTQWWLGFQVRP